ncbi:MULTISPECIES: DUF397 domain-containing protein [Streptomyces]|uniref:DUF397 domain-containing protein n=1 Tax=Streptomyces chengmaiensis TaxID=3040919 RepID=A0ABT6HQV2_9ACTN|nr:MULTISPECIES: DUF397 domain-containing protein [Streptomyces]MDH2390706.1 DUF397 domain-containing protein [Streptomyces chengmaiensis]WRQ78312.1 DUF397 domain-containing protein [Streptomyces sp. MUM 178J]
MPDMPESLPKRALTWRRSSRSVAKGNCVEAARLPDASLAVRDSKDVSLRPLRVSSPAWERFLAALGEGGVS